MALIFTDVDGTLLDDEGRLAVPVDSWCRACDEHEIVLTSSRDVGELLQLQHELGLRGALIAEDGAVVVERDGSVRLLGAPRVSLLERLTTALGKEDATALSELEPAAARNRLASVLLPAAVATGTLTGRLADAGLALTPGGRWATVTAGSDKGRAAEVLAAARGVAEWRAVGNAANDRPLLATAAHAFVIRNADGHDPVLAVIPGVTLIKVHGPEGWPEALPQT